MKCTQLLPLALAISEAVASSIPAVRNGIKPKRHISQGASQHGLQKRAGRLQARQSADSCTLLSPKFFIISMFTSEADVWYPDTDLNLYAQNITLPGLSPLFPDVHCGPSGEVCQITVGEGEINAASSISALALSPCFNLTSTYFMIAGISGINPHVATTGSVTFSRYAVQVNLQYEFAQSQIPSNDTSGYFPQNANYPDEYAAVDYPGEIYGTEVFELNENLKQRAMYIASLQNLSDTAGAAAYRASYPYAPANQPPAVVACDSATSDNYWSGSVLGYAFANYTLLLTNGSGLYCGTQQEDNATLEALLRAAISGLVDFSRIILMRTASDFDRAPPDETEVYHLLFADQEGFEPSIDNILIAGKPIIEDVLMYWNSTYRSGIEPGNYIGDAFDSLAGPITPDIGTPAIWIN